MPNPAECAHQENQTYWLSGQRRTALSVSSGSGDDSQSEIDIDGVASEDRLERLVDWNVEVFIGLIKSVVARRPSTHLDNLSTATVSISKTGSKPLDEVREIITLPDYQTVYSCDPDKIVIPKNIIEQLRQYGKFGMLVVECAASCL